MVPVRTLLPIDIDVRAALDEPLRSACPTVQAAVGAPVPVTYPELFTRLAFPG